MRSGDAHLTIAHASAGSSLRQTRLGSWWLDLSGTGRTGVLAALTGLVWAAALSQVRYDQLGDLGLVSVVPLWAYAAFIPLALSFVLVLSAPRVSARLAIVVTLVLIAILYGTSPLLSGEIRLAAAWRHLGVVDYVVQHGSVDPTLDVYHNWPGFFVLAATLVKALGIDDLRTIALWAPVWQSIAYLPALYVLFRSLTRDRRVVWLAIWVFYGADWIGQDYFSPQAVGFFIYLAMVAVIIRWLGQRDGRRPPVDSGEPDSWVERRRAGPLAAIRSLRERGALRAVIQGLDGLFDVLPPRGTGLSPIARASLAAAVVVVFGYVVMAHQLTPFFALGAVLLLMALRRVRSIVLAPLMGVMIGSWVVFAAVPYLSGHIQQLAEVGDALATNISGRVSGSPEHQLVVLARLGLTGFLWLVAVVGILRRLGAGSWEVTAGALLASPFPMLGLQSYGGEMLLRIALFSLPFAALLIASALLPKARPLRLPSQLAIGTLAVVVLSSFFLTRYGNERLETFTPSEVAATEELYATAPPGSLLLAISGNLPWKWTRYDEYRYRPIGDATFFGRADLLIDEARLFNGPVYLVVTRAQRAYTEMVLGEPKGAFDAFVDDVLATGQFRTVYENPDAMIAVYVPPPAGA